MEGGGDGHNRKSIGRQLKVIGDDDGGAEFAIAVTVFNPGEDDSAISNRGRAGGHE